MAKAKKQQPEAANPAAPPKTFPAVAPAARTTPAPAAAASAPAAPATQPAISSAPKAAKKSPAKKGESAAAPAPQAAKEAPKPPAKPAAPPRPLIDTNLAAAAAATMVAHRDALAGVTPSGPAAGAAQPAPETTRHESAAFKQLKDGVHKPVGGVGSLLGNPPGQKKSNLPFGGSKQSFRNQTFGADVNRSGVPRRTGG